MRLRLQWLAVASMIVVSSSVMASASSTAKISNLTFTLYDLDQTDGVSPSFEFIAEEAARGATSISVFAEDTALRQSGKNSLTLAQPFVHNTSDLLLENAVAVSFVEKYGVTAHGQAARGSTSYSANAVGTAGAYDDYYYPSIAGGIQLSPNALLIIKAEASVSASIDLTATCDIDYYCFYRPDRATASVAMILDDPDSAGIDAISSDFAQANYYTSDYDIHYGEDGYVMNPKSSQEKNEILSVVFTNNTDFSRLAHLTLSAQVDGVGYSDSSIDETLIPAIPAPSDAASPLLSVLSTTPDYTTYGFTAAVPEPSTWTFVLMGLVGVSAVARRSRQQA